MMKLKELHWQILQINLIKYVVFSDSLNFNKLQSSHNH